MEDANWYPIEQVVEASASRLREEWKNLVEEMNRAMMRWHLRDPSVTSRRKIRKRTLDRRSGPAHFN